VIFEVSCQNNKETTEVNCLWMCAKGSGMLYNATLEQMDRKHLQAKLWFCIELQIYIQKRK
jgi:hypothetical protein